ncbi:MAG: TonB-dependent receptor [Sphingobacteriales bacterium]|nr:TonB-dependent receptor [Sphingobacteriales bacterium]OJW01143.1 MAG: TonB-dependent receptor [Sphingobacteriales bacterium 44-61]
MRKLLSLLILALTTLSLASYAQVKTGKISGTVIDGSTKIIESATITLLRASDSAVVKMSVADKTGKYEFENVPEGRYIVAISAVGHDKGFSEVVAVSGSSSTVVKTIELVPQAQAMSGVTVTAKKPAIEQKPGKMVVNVDASPTNVGLNALELLEKSPGVTVDNDGNISVKGKQGVLILIDGKPTYMSGADLTALLKNMQSTSLDQIEIMTNPPAKYDAAGNSGIINIKTKKGIVKGMNGNANLGYTQGLYGRVNGGVNLNYRNNKLNIFGGYNGGTYEGYNRLLIDRRMYDEDKVTILRTIDQNSRPHFKGAYHNVKAGVDYYFSKKDVAGIVVNGSFNGNDEDPYSLTNIRNNTGLITNKLESIANNNRKSSNLTTNFNYKHTFDSTGREISADLDYAYYNNKNRTSLTTKSFDANNNQDAPDVLLTGKIPSDIRIYSAKVDYVHPFKNGLRLEAGAKTSVVKTDNKVNYLRDGLEAADRNNHFIYDENINAAYAILSRSIKKWELTAGLRMENTIAKGHQISNDSSFKRNYTNLFPNVGAGYNMNEKNQFNLSYSRRISRPDYDDLNPFIFFLDSLTYGQGNPYLQPQFTNNFEFSHTYNRFLTTTINYTNTTDIITDLLKQNTEKNITYQTKDNFSSMKQWGISLMANVPITKWWSANIYTNVFHNDYSGLYNNDPVKVKFTSFLGNMTNTFILGKGWNAELSGWYRSKAAEGILVANDMGAMNAAITKQLFDKKGTLKLGVRDILWTQQFSGYAKYSDINVDISSRRDSRQFNLSFSYRFGKKNIAPARRKTGGADDEQNRVKTGGGN